MLDYLALLLLAVILGVVVAEALNHRDEIERTSRPHAVPAERRLIAPCEAYGHLERMTSVGRGGYVAQFVCDRHCGWTALRKGTWRWPV